MTGAAAAAGGAAAGGAGAAAATGAAAAIGTKAAAGIATAAILAGGAAEIKNVTSHPSKPEPKVARKANAARPPAVTPAVPPAPATPPADAAAQTPPADSTPAQPTETVTVPPQPTDHATTGGTTTSNFPIGKHKRHKGNAVANTDSKGSTTSTQTAPVTTGVETSGCDADGNGATDPGAPSSCTTGSTPSSGLVEGSLQPAQRSAAPKRKRAATGGSKTPKKKR